MESSSRSNEKKRKATVSKEEVIEKLKDDGDFDNLRLKIIRKVKDNEELRNNIISVVRKSAALNRAGAENMKLRQLSNAIYDEVGSNLMSQLSDGVWEIIRSSDGMKNEITETVQSVYNKLVEPEKKEECKHSNDDAMLAQSEAGTKRAANLSATYVDGSLSDGEPPPGFSLSNNQHSNNHEQKENLHLTKPCEWPIEEQKQQPSNAKDLLEVGDTNCGIPPGFSANTEIRQECDGSDEDPDVPPGFG
ncbi:hypothetical protein Tsubulata_017955 [Turnera subulata]|uniref:Uncharacterized protein n=1 Tax=Turnera subulata TaxID=218843 RepID=A0A9Q0GFV7_9ROSI|nr:hypothetical protein Tsubulata_017955 [Turnera subulata]